MNAIHINYLFGQCNISERLRHTVVAVAHLFIMLTHAPTECHPLETEACGRHRRAATMHNSRSL